MSEFDLTIDEADVAANEDFTSLLSGSDFSVSVGSVSGALYQVPPETGAAYATQNRLVNSDLTEKVVGGDGTFDVLMSGFKAHLMGEYEAGRITSGDYTKAFIALTEAALSGAVQFLLGRDQAYWNAVLVRSQAQTAQVALAVARVQLETEKAKLQQTRIEAEGAKATFALTKMKLASERIAYQVSGFQFEYILPHQLKLLKEQIETQRAQTMDTRTDDTDVAGQLGKQKDLLSQQITSYKRDAEVKAAKLFTDAWITMKTLDEALTVPGDSGAHTGFTNTSLTDILETLKTNNEIG